MVDPKLGSPRTDEPTRHPWIWVVYIGLFGTTIPWYLPPEAASITWLGFPLWVSLSLVATFAIALFTVYVIGRFWSEDE